MFEAAMGIVEEYEKGRGMERTSKLI